MTVQAGVPRILPGNGSLTEVPPTAGACWLRPSGWPDAAGFLFRPRPPDSSISPVVVTRYSDILSMMLDPAGIWRREIPLSIVPAEERHCVVDASWLLDGEQHTRLRHAIRGVNRGSSPAARRFTRDLTRLLTARLMQEEPPWNLARVIDEVSIRIIVEHTLQAPSLLPHTARIRELTRTRAPHRTDDGTDVLAYFQTLRQPEYEDILATVADRPGDLPAGGLARHLASLAETGAMTRRELVSQLGMLIISYESQAAVVSSLTGMLLEYGYFEQARRSAGDPGAMRRLVSEGGRRGLSFPFNILTPAVPVTMSGRSLPAGKPVAISYAAANMDPDRFGPGAAGFDPCASRPPHLAFGEGIHRCQGEQGAGQFTEDVLLALFATLPPGVQLGHDGQVLREVASLSWAIATLPVVPPQ